jgi:hypothetical protein
MSSRDYRANNQKIDKDVVAALGMVEIGISPLPSRTKGFHRLLINT